MIFLSWNTICDALLPLVNDWSLNSQMSNTWKTPLSNFNTFPAEFSNTCTLLCWCITAFSLRKMFSTKKCYRSRWKKAQWKEIGRFEAWSYSFSLILIVLQWANPWENIWTGLFPTQKSDLFNRCTLLSHKKCILLQRTIIFQCLA